MSGGTGSMGGNMGGGTGNAGGSNETESEREDSILRLNEDMRLAWLNHVYWTRMYLMSAVADNADQQAVEERLLETADEITNSPLVIFFITITQSVLMNNHLALKNAGAPSVPAF